MQFHSRSGSLGELLLSFVYRHVDQSLNQILDRISRQIDLAYELRDGVLVIGPDLPYLKSYQIDYVNMTRDSSSDIKTSTDENAGAIIPH